MKLQNLTVIFIIIILPVMLITSLYISTGLRTIEFQARYDTGLINATYDAIYAFEHNTANIKLSDNPEIKRSIINSSIKMFEKSLCHTCNISSYNTNEIEQYIPAIVFGMYDGFYMYAPSNSKNPKTGESEYKHNLKNYVYYSETLKGIGENGSDIVITYSLDNYVTVSGDFVEKTGEVDEGYITRSGYLTVYTDDFKTVNDELKHGNRYRTDIIINPENIDGKINSDAMKYYWESFIFTEWFNDHISDELAYLQINDENDPEDPNSPFVQHKRTVMKNKIEGVLNSSITAYSQKTLGNVYKMPKLTEEDWNKVYSNISMITFFQGKNIGFIRYNGYCVLNSTNNTEYVNPNLMYFIDGTDDTNHYYHDIRCDVAKNSSNKLIGYKIGAFRSKKLDETNANGTEKYVYDHNALACYECVNAPFSTNQSIYEYIWSGEVEDDVKSAYWTSLARERYNSKRVSTGKIRVRSKDGIRIGYYNDMDTALAECKDGDTLEILDSITATTPIELKDNRNINITIIGNMTTTRVIYVGKGNTLNMTNMTITRRGTNTLSNEKNMINNEGNLNINNCTIVNEAASGFIINNNIASSKVIINNSTIKNESEDGLEAVVNHGGEVIINYSSINNNSQNEKTVLVNDQGNVTINNSNIKNESENILATLLTNGGNIVINNSKIENKNGEGEETVSNNGSNVTINVNN